MVPTPPDLAPKASLLLYIGFKVIRRQFKNSGLLQPLREAWRSWYSCGRENVWLTVPDDESLNSSAKLWVTCAVTSCSCMCIWFPTSYLLLRVKVFLCCSRCYAVCDFQHCNVGFFKIILNFILYCIRCGCLSVPYMFEIYFLSVHFW